MIESACGESSSRARLRWCRETEVDLGDRGRTAALLDVDEQPEVDAVALHERHALEHGPAAAYSPDRGWTMRVSDGKSSEITGRATSSVVRPPVPGRAVSGRS